LKKGDHVIICSSVFGSTHTLATKYLGRYGISFSYGKADAVDQWKKLVTPDTRMIFLETPTNPGLDIIDLEKVAGLTKAKNLLLVVDNCFATPIIQKPIDWGADLVIHSGTKWIDGQGRVLGGVIVGRKDLIKEIYWFCRTTGPTMSPFNAWVLSKSLETLEIRMERHAESAFHIARRLYYNENIHQIKYPWLHSHPQHTLVKKQMKNGGGILCFELSGGLEAGKKFLDRLKMISVTANLGDTKTIASHPASTTHAKLTEDERREVNITPGLIRISAGLEHCEDIVGDILQALEVE
jgi:O-succinylhomoserine sulfhydrylase